MSLGRSQHPLRLPDEPSAVILADVAVARDPQQVQRHVKRHAGGDRLERLLAVGKMTAVLPQEMPDERLRVTPVAGVAHERVLELASHPPDVEQPVPALHAFQVNGGDVQSVSEQEVSGSGVAVQPDLAVLPHLRSFPPAIAQSAELVDVLLPDALGPAEPSDDRVEV